MLSVVKSVCLTLLVTSISTLLPVTQASAAPADLLAAGRVDEVIATSQSQLKSSPNDAASYNLLCRAYFAVEDWDRSIAACEKAVSLAPNNSDYHLWLGRAYGEKADRSNPFTGASLARKLRKEFEAAVKLNANNVEARSDLAEFYIDAPGIIGGGIDKARAQADALMSIAPPKAHYISGRIAERNKDQRTAEHEYRAAIDASHGAAVDWFNLALFHRHNSQFGQMEKVLAVAVKAPGHDEIMVEAAEMLVRTGRNLLTAGELVRQYLESGSPTEKAPIFQAHYVLGTVLEKQGNKQGAAREYQAALTLASNFSPAKQGLERVGK